MKRIVASREDLKGNFTIDLSLLFVEKGDKITLNENYFNRVSKKYKDLICEYIESAMATLCSDIKSDPKSYVQGLIYNADLFPDKHFLELGRELDNIRSYNQRQPIESIEDIEALFKFMSKGVKSFFENDSYGVLSAK